MTMLVYRVDVRGMTCGGCERALSKRIEFVPGAEVMTIDHQSGAVRVLRDSELAPMPDIFEANLRAAIEDAGFELATITQLPAPG